MDVCKASVKEIKEYIGEKNGHLREFKRKD